MRSVGGFRHARPLVIALLLVVLSGGCGDSDPRETASAKQPDAKRQIARTYYPANANGQRRTYRNTNAVPIQLTSDSVTPDGVIGRRYECRREVVWLPLKWGKVPPSTKALVLISERIAPADDRESAPRGPISGYLLANLTPTTRQLRVGKFPAEALAIVYRPKSYCPRARGGQSFFFQIYALPSVVDPQALSTDSLTSVAREAIATGAMRARYGVPRG